MSVDIKVVETKKDQKKYAKFPFALYKGNEYWVPQLITDELEIFNPAKNPAYSYSETKQFLAYKDGEIVGRVAAILNNAANKKYNTKNLRFGWFDAIDDKEVVKALFDAVEAWGKEKGMETLTGPHGFTDLDPEGMLIEGFDQLPTIAVYYNYPYYQGLMEGYGFEKEIDYKEYRAKAPLSQDDVPDKVLRLGERIKKRSALTMINFKSRKHMMSRAKEIFQLVDEAFDEIYGSVPLTREQIDYYVKKYISFAEPDLIQVAENSEGKIVGFMIALPSLSRAFQKAKGRLFPFGLFYLLRALKKNDTMDFYLAGVSKKYRGQGVDLMMVMETIKACIRRGFLYAESNPELENNEKIQAQWKYFDPVQHKRRRIFRKNIG